MSDDINPQTSPFNPLPEGCIANIISLTSPKDACRVAAVSLGFKSAADSDTVWERFLPPNFEEVVSRATSPLAFKTKKQLFFLLRSSTLLLDGGKLSFWLTKSGEKEYMLSARELQIASIDNPKHWGWTSLPESRFAEVAELRSICKLEIRGKIPARMLSPQTKYVAWLMYAPCHRFSGLDYPSKASIKFVKEDGTEMEGETTKIYIDTPNERFMAEGRSIIGIDGQLSWALDDYWYGIELGEFFIGEGVGYDVHIQVSETERLNLKKGLIIDGIKLQSRKDNVFSRLSVLRESG
ncbi:hypothetical protein C2S52_014838 [Perilla frutescens var. hirtella]|nr:hypothetical protein C2S52_014838 [Perilla frutescens var. hirtella]KAH6816320.1 hypothetical protein C2S51_021140 [Perilla frutescens var. frutescens]